MNIKQFCLAIFVFLVFEICNSYDPAAEQTKRLDRYRKICQKYNDDLTYEYQGKINSAWSTILWRVCSYETWGFPVVKLGSTRLPVMVYKDV